MSHRALWICAKSGFRFKEEAVYAKGAVRVTAFPNDRLSFCGSWERSTKFFGGYSW